MEVDCFDFNDPNYVKMEMCSLGDFNQEWNIYTYGNRSSYFTLEDSNGKCFNGDLVDCKINLVILVIIVMRNCFGN